MTYLVLAGEPLVWDLVFQVGVKQGTEGDAIIPTATEVCDVNALQRNIHCVRTNHHLTATLGLPHHQTRCTVLSITMSSLTSTL